MDCESGIKQRQSFFSWLHLIVVGGFVFSLLAFLLASVAFLHTQGEARPGDALAVGGTRDRDTGDEYGSDQDALLNEELEIDDTAVSMRRTQRRAGGRNGEHCFSEYSANSTVKPSAHIISGSQQWRTVPDRVMTGAAYSILSQQWYCNKFTTPAYVKGGMVFNHTTGYLTVPVSGVYFVYSQVHLRLVNKLPVNMNTLIHKVVTENAGQQNTHPLSVMESILVATKPGRLHPSYQGGLFSLERGERIGVAIGYSLEIDPTKKFEYYAYWTASYMGAFLVE